MVHGQPKILTTGSKTPELQEEALVIFQTMLAKKY